MSEKKATAPERVELGWSLPRHLHRTERAGESDARVAKPGGGGPHRRGCHRHLDGERVLGLLRMDLRGKTSGLELDARWTRGAEVVQMKDDRVTAIVKYFDRDRALADLRLTE